MEKIFQDVGLDETEAKIYNALMELGPSTVTEITKRARITRTLGYHVLEKLEWYGLVGRAGGEGKKMKYAIEHPENLLQFVKNKKQAWEERIVKAENILPDLLSLYKINDKPTIRYQQGVQGIITAHEDMLETRSEVLTLTDLEVWKDTEYWEWVQEWHNRRDGKNFKERALVIDGPVGREVIKNQKFAQGIECRLIDKSKAKELTSLGGEIHVYDNKLMIAVMKKPNRMGVIIESEVLVNMIRLIFDLAWENVDPKNTKKS